MKTSWKKVMLIAVPLLVVAGGAGYAIIGSTTTKTAEGSTNASNVSAQVISSQALTAEEVAQLGSAKPAPVTADASATTSTGVTPTSTTSTVDQATLDANNPFVMQSAPATTQTAQAPAPSATPATPVASNFQVSLVKDMSFETNTTQGKLKVEFKQEDGTFKLEGDLAGRKLDVKGEQALQIMNQLLSGYHLQDALSATLQGKQVQLDPTVLNAIQTLNVELQDGRKIESKGKPSKTDKEESKDFNHDNGKHKGQQKQEEKGKGNKHED